MKKISALILPALFLCTAASAQIFGPGHHIIAYSTHAVDTTLARPKSNKAVALIRTGGDTLIDYINRAKYTIDIALYDFVEDSNWYEQGYVPPISKAINAAYARGVKIRWICNPTDSSAGFNNAITPNYSLFDSVNKSIPKLQRTDLSGIMHNKFVIIDGTSSNPNDPIVWTGCMNWEPGQINKDINNIIIFQDSGLAHCYLHEFNQMWGDTVEGGQPNKANAKFGANKHNVCPRHSFWIDGYKVEAWFSPQADDSTSNHIISLEQSAKSEIDFEMFTFTYVPDDQPLVAASKKGLAVRGIIDQESYTYQPNTDLSNALGTNFTVYFGLPGYDQNSICHSKYMIVDPCDHAWNADPTVLTGSHNWSASAEDYNDENTVIVHDSLIANQYYQAFHSDFEALTNQDLSQTCIPLSTNDLKSFDNVTYYPNPATSSLRVTINFPGSDITYSVYNVTGQIVLSGKLDARYVNTINTAGLTPGMYLLQVENGDTEEFTGKFIKQ